MKHASHSSFTWPKSWWLSATVWKTESYLMKQYCNTSFCPTLYNNRVISNSISLGCLCCHSVCTVLSRTLNHLRPPRLLCFFSLKQHVLGFCLALSASLIPLLSSAHTCPCWMHCAQCTPLTWLLLCAIAAHVAHLAHKCYTHVCSFLCVFISEDMCVTCRGLVHTRLTHELHAYILFSLHP